VYSNLGRWPRGRYNSGVSFGCDPSRVDELLAAVRQEIAALQADGPSEEIVAKVKEAQRRGHETAVKQNRYWLAEIEALEVNGLPLTEMLEFEQQLSRITRESLRDAAREFFSGASFIEGVLYPAETPAATAAPSAPAAEGAAPGARGR
jgi:zinc protease